MSQTTFSANLLTEQFPYNFYELSSSVEINRGLEKNQSGPAEPYFAENVLPIMDGFTSIGFTEKVPANESLGTVRTSFVVYGENGRLALFVSDDVAAWVYDPRGAEWSQVELPIANFDSVTHATIREVTYIYLGTGLYKYDFNSQILEAVSLEGINAAAVNGVSSAGGRLILWDSNRIYYSSPIEPTEFTPGLDTGAGSSGVEDLSGKIVACVTLGKDFIIYSNISAVSGRATDNPNLPFRYKEIPGSAGVNFLRHVAYNSNTGIHIVWTNSGFQQVSVEQAQYIWPELSDGIIRGLLIRRHQLFGVPVIKRAKQLDVRISFVSNRYIAISIIDTEKDSYVDCFFLDTVIQRWGKLSVPHAGFIEYVLPEVFDTYTYNDLEADYFAYSDLDGIGISYSALGANEPEAVEQGVNLGIILPNGSVQAISHFETSDFRGTDGSEIGAATPTLFLGRYKVVREEGIQTQWIKLRKLFDAELYWYGHTYDGSIARTEKIVHESPNQRGHWFGRMSADSVSLELRGNFKLTDLNICVCGAGQVNQLSEGLEVEVVQSSQLFEEPEYDYATSVLYPIIERDFLTLSNAINGPAEVVQVVFREDTQTENLSLSANITGLATLATVVVEKDYPDTGEGVILQASVSGAANLNSILIESSYGPDEPVTVYTEVTGYAELLFVAIRRNYEEVDNVSVQASISGHATLETF